jgi:hypothetical protein
MTFSGFESSPRILRETALLALLGLETPQNIPPYILNLPSCHRCDHQKLHWPPVLQGKIFLVEQKQALGVGSVFNETK